MGKNCVQAKQWLDESYSNFLLPKTTVKKSYADCRRSRTDTNDAER